MSLEEVVEETRNVSLTVDNFSALWATEDAKFESEEFDAGGGRFRFRISKKENGKVRVSFDRVDQHALPIHAKIQAEDWKRSKEACNMVFLAAWSELEVCDTDKTTKEGWGWPNWCHSTELATYAASNSDIIKFKGTITTTRPVDCSLSELKGCLQGKNTLRAFKEFGASSVTLKADDGFELQMPKALLCLHSSVLKAALESNMMEASQGSVTMTDMKQEALEDLATCLYDQGLPSSVATSSQRLFNLLIAADKYGIQPLVEALSRVLSTNISRKNAAWLLQQADSHSLIALRRALIHFVAFDTGNLDAVTGADEYSSFSADLLRDLFAHRGFKRKIDETYGKQPLMLQWGQGAYEFKDDSEWEKLAADSLRRACFERNLATSGTSAELISRLSSKSTGDTQQQDEPEAKKRRAS